jgi:hypothetical protein
MILTNVVIISSLKSPERDQRYDQVEKNFGHTFSWAFENPSISLPNWLRGGKGIFWINGKPGSGKTTFMKFLLNDRRTKELLHRWKSKPGQIVASFFFHYRGTHIQKSFEGLLGSLLSQLLEGDLRLCRIVGELLDKEASDLKETVQADVSSFLQNCKIKSLSSTDRNRMIALLSENPSLQLLHIMREQLRLRLPDERLKIIKALLVECENLSRATRDRSLYAGVEMRLVDVLKKYFIHEKESKKIIRTWYEGLDVSSRLRNFLREVGLDIFDSIDEEHISRLFERQTARKNRLISIQCQGWKHSNLEEGLRRIFNQNAFDLEIFLFFDALDEYDGTPEFISEFLKSLVEVKPTSKTLTKILFSSRPWAIFRDHFNTCPSLSIHEHTMQDILDYCAGSLPYDSRERALVLPFVREIAHRARGVFVWVKLVMADLTALVTAIDGADEELSRKLRQCLDSLPDELEDYYATIIQRLPASTRRESYILLECLSRSSKQIMLHEVPVLLACGMSDSIYEAQDIIENESAPGLTDPERHTRTISGSMIDILPLRNTAKYTLQLMHQSVKDWVELPTFKHNILGTHADMTWENGHSFLVKYHTYQAYCERDGVSRSRIFDHLVKSEMTTGVSQYTYLSQLPVALLARLSDQNVNKSGLDLCTPPGRPSYPVNEIPFRWTRPQKRRATHVPGPLVNSTTYGLELAAVSGLSLYLADAVRHDRSIFRRLVGPLLSTLLKPARYKSAVQQPDTVLGRLSSTKLILDNGFGIHRYHGDVSLIFDGIWRSPDRETAELYIDLVLTAAQNELNSNIRFDTDLDRGHPTSLLHISPPKLAKFLLEKSVNPNMLNGAGQTPLDYILEPDSVFQRCLFGLDWLYDVVQFLIENGGRRLKKTRYSDIQAQKLLRKLKDNGYDISPLLSLQRQSPDLDEQSVLTFESESGMTDVTGSEVSAEQPEACDIWSEEIPHPPDFGTKQRKARNRRAKVMGGSVISFRR